MTNINHIGGNRIADFAACFCVGTLGLKINDRFRIAALSPCLNNIDQSPSFIARYRQNRMEQPVNHKAVRRDNRCDRIHKKGHIGIDHDKPHLPLTVRIYQRIDHDAGFA